MTDDEFVAACRADVHAKNQSYFAFADRLAAGFEEYGDKKMKDVCARSDWRGFLPLFPSCKILAAVALKFPPERRHDNLSVEHHKSVMKLSAKDADMVLNDAEANNWTAPETAYEARRLTHGGRTPVAASMRVTISMLSMKQARRTWPNLSDSEICDRAVAMAREMADTGPRKWREILDEFMGAPVAPKPQTTRVVRRRARH